MTLRFPLVLALGLFLACGSLAVAATADQPGLKKPVAPPQVQGNAQAGKIELRGMLQITTTNRKKTTILTTQPNLTITDYYLETGNAAKPAGVLYTVATIKSPYFYTGAYRTVCLVGKDKNGNLTLIFCKEQYQVQLNGKLGWLDKVDANNNVNALELTPALDYFTKKIADSNYKDSFSYGRRALAKELQIDGPPPLNSSYQAALRDYDEAIWVNPTPTLYNNRGCCRFKAAKQAADKEGKKGEPKYANAMEDFKTAYKSDPKMAEAYYNYGLCQELQGNYLDAFAQYVAAAVADNTDPVGFFGARGCSWIQRQISVLRHLTLRRLTGPRRLIWILTIR